MGVSTHPKSVERDSGWRDFKSGDWRRAIDVRDFIAHNVTPYLGDEGFLTGSTPRTQAVWAKLQPYFEAERKKESWRSMPSTLRRSSPTRPATLIAKTK